MGVNLNLKRRELVLFFKISIHSWLQGSRVVLEDDVSHVRISPLCATLSLRETLFDLRDLERFDILELEYLLLVLSDEDFSSKTSGFSPKGATQRAYLRFSRLWFFGLPQGPHQLVSEEPINRGWWGHHQIMTHPLLTVSRDGHFTEAVLPFLAETGDTLVGILRLRPWIDWSSL